MKRIICLITALCLVFGSFSFCFAQDWSATDSQNLQNVAGRLYYMNQSAAYYLYNIATNTNNIYNKTVDIYNALFNNGHNITYWVKAISDWMSPIYTAVTSIPTDLSVIQGLLGYPSTDNGVTTWHPYLKNIADGTVNAPSYIFSMNNNAGGYIDTFNLTESTNPIKDLSNYAYWFLWTQMTINNKMIDIGSFITNYYNATQNAVNWGSLSTSTFTPSSFADGTYKWLSAIQAPVARLSYVLANDQEIDARDAAAANQEAVIDNFIDSSGSGAASTSDIGSISDLSSGYKSNFGSDASVTGIFNIFNSNNMGWFSSETYNQLDTTSNNRRTKSDSLPDTPLLDQKINDIYEAIGLDNDR